MYILGISCFYHEAAAALIKDGKIIAASAEERFSRQKHDPSFPMEAINFCLKHEGLSSQDLSYVVFYEKPFLKFERNLINSLQHFPKSAFLFSSAMKNFLSEKLWIKFIIAQKLKINPQKILFVPHHLSHAAASFYLSPFKEATFLTIDGVGEWSTASWGKALGNKLYPISEMRFPDSIGLLYSAFTAYLGFKVNDGEYSVMGMAGYGQKTCINKIRKLYKQGKDGSIKLNLAYFSFHYSNKQMYSKLFIQEFEGLNRFDIASSLQHCLQEIILNLSDYIYKQTNTTNLVYGGGVALNSVINSQITKKTPFKNIFIYPASGDDGGAIGAALYACHHVLDYPRNPPINNVFLGQNFSSNEINKFLTKLKIKAKKYTNKGLTKYIAQKISKGKVIGWFEGRAEFGPRSLGHRSILADPRDPKMRDLVNFKIKFREEFRPFAPAVLEGYQNDYFQEVDNNLSRFMLGTFKVRPNTKKLAPSVVHVDGTARVQSVAKDSTSRFRLLLEEYFSLTGLPMLLNTSFNFKGEPIVNSLADAYQTFIKSGLDILVLENYLIEKKPANKV